MRKKSSVKNKIKTVKKTNTKSKKDIYVEYYLKNGDYSLCVPIVKKNDKVTKGMRIARPQGFGNNIYSSVDGVVFKVSSESIIVKTDNKLKENSINKLKNIKLDKKDIENCLSELNLTNTYDHLDFYNITKNETKYYPYLIIDVKDKNKNFCHSLKAILKYKKEVAKGIKYIMSIFNSYNCIISIPEKYTKEITDLKKGMKSYRYIKVLEISNDINDGDDLIKACVSDLEYNSNKNIAYIVSVETAIRAYDIMDMNTPFIYKNLSVVSISKKEVKVKELLNIPIGTKVKDILEFCNFRSPKHLDIITNNNETINNINYSINNYVEGIVIQNHISSDNMESEIDANFEEKRKESYELYIKQHLNDKAILRINKNAREVLRYTDFEDPKFFDDLLSSGLVSTLDAITIGEAVGKSLSCDLESLSCVTENCLLKNGNSSAAERKPENDNSKKGKFIDKVNYFEGYVKSIDLGIITIEIKGNMGTIKVPKQYIITYDDLEVGQLVAFNMSFIEQII